MLDQIPKKVPVTAINHDPAKLIYLNFHSLEIVSRFRDPKLQIVLKSYSHLFYFSANICASLCLKTHFIPNIGDLVVK